MFLNINKTENNVHFSSKKIKSAQKSFSWKLYQHCLLSMFIELKGCMEQAIQLTGFS